MFTVKQVSELTGISVRTLHYYDEVNLFKPSKVTESGYRLYDENALGVLQQILFFKELDFPLKDIKTIMLSQKYDKHGAYIEQKKLLKAKRDRLNGLLDLLDKLIRGEENMSFKEFDMSEYFNLLKTFRENHADEIVQIWGSMDVFDKTIDKIKANKEKAAQAAIQYYGSIEKYTEAMKEHLDELPKKAQNLSKYSNEDYMEKTTQLIKKLTSDLSKDASSNEIQCIVDEWVKLVSSQINGLDNNFWCILTNGYFSDSTVIETNDKLYGKGASAFIGKALKVYWNC